MNSRSKFLEIAASGSVPVAGWRRRAFLYPGVWLGSPLRWPLLMVVVVGALFLDRIPTLGNVRRDRGRHGQRCPMGTLT